MIPDCFQLPTGEHRVEPAGVAINSKGHIYIFHRGKHPLMEFDSSGKFLRSVADDLFVTAHMVRVDPEDNIWTTDIGSHVVLKLSPEGRVLLALGRMRIPGDDVLHFNQPTDLAGTGMATFTPQYATGIHGFCRSPSPAGPLPA